MAMRAGQHQKLEHYVCMTTGSSWQAGWTGDRSGQTGEIGEAVWLFVPLYLHAMEGLRAWAPGEYPSNRDTPCLTWTGVSTAPSARGTEFRRRRKTLNGRACDGIKKS